jgi:MoaA/NifB/PqqE/SkfB family radical SAM enzyme
MPILGHYYITNRCNARCSFCPIWKEQPALMADPENVRRHLGELRSVGVRFADFTGGEPLLHPDLPRFLTWAKSHGLRTTVTTNCILYPKKAKELKGLVDFLHFSLDAANPELHDRLRGVPCFEKVMESIDIALTLGERPDILYTATLETCRELPVLADFARKRQLMLIINPLFPLNGNNPLELGSLEVLHRESRKPYVYLNNAQYSLMMNGGNQVDNPRCRVVDSTVVISPDNHLLLPCYHYHNQKIGLDKPLKEILHSQEHFDARSRQGRFCFCDGCTINCYFDPSFLYKFDRYFVDSLIPKAKYAWHKYLMSHRARNSTGSST